MGKAKPWQIVLIVVAILVSAGWISMLVFKGGGPQLGERAELVDLSTGDRWWVNLKGKRRVSIPAKHPDTGLRTLVRAFEEDGVWKSVEIGSAANFVDPELFTAVDSFDQGTLNISDAPIKQYRPGG